MLNKIKSKYILKKIILEYLKTKLYLNLVLYNKKLQIKLGISKKDYIKYYNQIIIELTPKNRLENQTNYFINILEKYKPYFHIYFNNNDKEEQKIFIKNEDNVKKIKIVIDEEVISFKNLFQYCECLEGINIIKCKRNNIINMYSMFENCSSLINLNVEKLITENVITMRAMFHGCSSLKILNLSKFNTKNVYTMYSMFSNCISLTDLNIDGFDTSNVTNMGDMFYKCKSLKNLNINHLNTDKVTKMTYMFYHCDSLIELNISNFNLEKVEKMEYMFSGCSKELQDLVKRQNNKLKESAFIKSYY